MRFLLIVLVAVFTLQLTACNTVEGVGKDIERGGEELQKAAD